MKIISSNLGSQHFAGYGPQVGEGRGTGPAKKVTVSGLYFLIIILSLAYIKFLFYILKRMVHVLKRTMDCVGFIKLGK